MQKELAQTFIGSYFLQKKLGSSPFTTVYLAEDTNTHTCVAIKTQNLQEKLAPDLEDFLLSRTRTTARLHHPHIIHIFSFGEQDRTEYFTMQYAHLGSIRQNYSQGSRLPLQTILQYTRQIADALQYAHGQQIIHTYLKPENILLETPEYVLVSDFGPASNIYLSHITEASMPPSVYCYIAPEQISGEPQPASDQYALAAMVYEWICGTPPFIGSAQEVLAQQLHSEPTPLHEKVLSIPLLIDEVLQIALAKDPKRRFASVDAFATALEQAFFA